jgi:hypothetical protein
MDFIPYDTDEEAQLYGSDAPEVRYDPWGPSEIPRERLQDADYLARKLLDFASGPAGPLGWALNYAVPRPKPGSETMKKVDTGLDYVSQFLGPLLGFLATKQVQPTLPGKSQSPYLNKTLDTLESWSKSKPWQKLPPQTNDYWTHRRAPDIGGLTGRGKSIEEIMRHRAPIEMADEAVEAVIKKRLSDMGIPYHGPAGARGQTAGQIDDEMLDMLLKKMWGDAGKDLGGPFKLPPLPGE